MVTKWSSAALLVLLVCFCCFSAIAQRVTSDLAGTVTDQTGAVIPAVSVTITDRQTGHKIATETNELGYYHVAGLMLGTYEIRLERDGFQTQVLTGIRLMVNQQAQVDARLTVGPRSEHIKVSAQPMMAESSTSQLSSVVNESTLHELPLNGRDLFQLTLLQTGVVATTNAGPNPFAEGGITKAAVQGTRPTMNNINLDGGDINDPAFNIPPGGVAGTQMGVEAVQEFRVLLNSYSAEFGRNAGANVQLVTKAGTNEFRGSLFEFVRNAALDARNFFDFGDTPPFTRNQFGVSLGGPIVRNRAFFFSDYEGLRENKSVTASLTVPDTEARRGMLPSAADPSKLVDVGVAPQVASFLNLFPQPNGAELGGGLAALQISREQPTREDYGVLRFDYWMSPRDMLFARYVVDDSDATVPFLSTFVPGFPGERTVRDQYLMLNWQKIILPNIVNEAKFNLNRTHYRAETANSYPESISLVPNRALGVIAIAGLPALGNNLIYPIASTSNTFEGIDNLSWQHGAHMLRVGTDVKRLQINGPFDLFINGEYQFSDLTAFGFPAVSNNPALEFFLKADPFLYLGVDPALSNSDRGFRQNYLGFYGNDDWRVNSRLTLNLGLRWEFWSNPTEANGRIANIRDLLHDTAPTPGKLWNGVPLDQWSPRVGFAWKASANNKTVVRGGAALVRDQIWANLYFDARFYEPYYRALLYILPNFQAPPLSVSQLAGAGGPPSVIGSFGITYRPDFPYYLEYNLNVQRELTPNVLLQVAYVGSRGNHLPRTGEVNPAGANGVRLNPNFGSIPLLSTDAQSFYNSGQLSLQKRFSSGLSFQASYTLSKSIDDQSGPFPSDYVSESGVAQNFFNRKADRGRSSFDRKNVLVLNYLYDLPLYRGGTRNLPGKLLHGWSAGGIINLSSGAPFTANLGSFNNSGTFASFPADRPNVKAGANPCGATILGRPDRWFDPSIFTLPAAGEFGNSGRNTLCGPSLKDFDFSLLKQTKLTETMNLEFRAEFFNLFNHANFDVPVNTQGPNGSGGNGDAVFIGRLEPPCQPASDRYACGVLAPNVGRIQRTVTTSRQIQFGLKLIF